MTERELLYWIFGVLQNRSTLDEDSVYGIWSEIEQVLRAPESPSEIISASFSPESHEDEPLRGDSELCSEGLQKASEVSSHRVSGWNTPERPTDMEYPSTSGSEYPSPDWSLK